METRALGTSGIEVSALALGSWQTYERIDAAARVSVLQAAREAGVTFLEVARYDDSLGTAPIPTGYSEVVFGEAFAASGWPRAEVVIAEKLWWEFWPSQTAAQELGASLQRTGLEYVDFLYSDPPPPELPLERVVAEVTDLIGAGRIRGWGIVNWPAERLFEAASIAAAQDVPAPCAAQLPYSIARRDWVEDPAMAAALAACEASLIPSFVFAGGVLTGKYARGGHGRLDGTLDPALVALAGQLTRDARARGTTPAALALEFVLGHPRTAAVLVGATSPEQVRENAAVLM